MRYTSAQRELVTLLAPEGSKVKYVLPFGKFCQIIPSSKPVNSVTVHSCHRHGLIDVIGEVYPYRYYALTDKGRAVIAVSSRDDAQGETASGGGAL